MLVDSAAVVVVHSSCISSAGATTDCCRSVAVVRSRDAARARRTARQRIAGTGVEGASADLDDAVGARALSDRIGGGGGEEGGEGETLEDEQSHPMITAMSKLRMLLVVATILVLLLAETAHRVEARPGPPTLYAAETVIVSRRLLSAAERVENVNLADRDAEELDFEEELDAVCIEDGSCDEKRLLTESIDYKNDGPNNPITDPPH